MVQITIDTKRDSDEEIRRTITYLRSLIGDVESSYSSRQESSQSTNDYDAPSANVEAAFSMFGANDANELSDSFEETKQESKKSSQKSDEEVVFEIVEY